MKRFLIGLCFLMFCLPGFGQRGELVMKSGVNFSLDIADSLMYVLPHYSMGVVVFKDGGRSQALLNINTLDQRVSFIDGKGDTLFVANESDVASVYVMNRYFRKWGASLYLEILNPRADVSVALGRSLVLSEPVKEGAYGSKSSTTSVTTIRQFSDAPGSIRDLSNYVNVPWKYVFNVYLSSGEKVMTPSKKSFVKLFPSRAEFISEYVKENDVDFRDLEQVQALLDICTEE